jgi:polyphosphate kinase
VVELDVPLDLRPFTSLFELDRPDLKPPSWTPQEHPRPPATEDLDVFSAIRDGDVLIHHPYHSFTSTVQRFLDQAADDPDVLAIKAAIYRTARDSKVIESLIRAARNDKQVAVMVELKARFDEENNLRWVERLEEEGIHVAYGTLGLKTHTKTTLVVREEGDDVRLYSHVATGNYHSETAKQYEDMGLLTADPDVGYDLVKLFNFFTGHALHEDYRKLLIAPTNMRDRFRTLIRREAEHAQDGRPARIVAKVNRLEDPELIAELYRASMAGVDIDLLVRDICRLRPGLDGVSETLEVRSIVGPFLEHSRVFRFENDGDPQYFIGSADWMARNLDNRVEAVVPIEDTALRQRIDEVLETMLADNRRAWVMDAEGRYEQLMPGDDPVIDTQDRLKAWARRTAPAQTNRIAGNGSPPSPPSQPGPVFPDRELAQRIRRSVDDEGIGDQE